jgi:hypothetical protein
MDWWNKLEGEQDYYIGAFSVIFIIFFFAIAYHKICEKDDK